MMEKKFMSVIILMIFLVSSGIIISAFGLPENENGEIDLKAPRIAEIQNTLDKKILASYFGDELFVYAKNIRLGYRNQKTNKFTKFQRDGNYIFENEKILVNVFVRNPEGVGDIENVVITLGDVQGSGNDVESKCVPNLKNKRNLNRKIKFNSQTDRWYKCEFTAETPYSMYGEYWITAEVRTFLGEVKIAENMNLYYFFNPYIAISADGDIYFEDVEEGEIYLSTNLLIGNDGDRGSGVPLEFFISGTNFYDSSSSEALCPISNELSLRQLKFQVEYGGIKTKFKSIPYGNYFNEDVIKPLINGATVLPGGEMKVVFRLKIPRVCSGSGFDTGSIYFWARPKDPSPYAKMINIGLGISPDIALKS